MKHIYTEIVIQSSPDNVWEALTDFNLYPEWNPFITQISGELTQGSYLSVTLQLKANQSYKFSPLLLDVEIRQRLRWKGKLFLPGLFDGEHSFRLVPHNQGTLFVQEEVFTGVLTHLLPSSLYEDTKKNFERMNQALKNKVESIK